MCATARLTVRAFAVLCAGLPFSSSAQSLSAALGATKLDGLKNFADCQNQQVGHREHLIADRIEAKLAQSPALTAEQRNAWFGEIAALRARLRSIGAKAL
jgi:hypothetical protein